MTLNFSEPVYNLTLSALSLTLGGGSNLLTPLSGATVTAVSPNSSGGSATWTLSNLSSLTKTAGSYAATLTTAGSGVTDLAGNPLAGSASTSFTVSAPVAPSPPALLATDDTGISSSDDITNLTTALTFTGTAPASNTVTLYSGNSQVGSGMATAGGTYSITTTSGLSPGTYTIAAKDTDSYGNISSASSSTTVIVDATAPTASITAVSPNPTSLPVSQLTINFSEPIYDLTLSSLNLTLNGGSNLLTGSERHAGGGESQFRGGQRHLDFGQS